MAERLELTIAVPKLTGEVLKLVDKLSELAAELLELMAELQMFGNHFGGRSLTKARTKIQALAL